MSTRSYLMAHSCRKFTLLLSCHGKTKSSTLLQYVKKCSSYENVQRSLQISPIAQSENADEQKYLEHESELNTSEQTFISATTAL